MYKQPTKAWLRLHRSVISDPRLMDITDADKLCYYELLQLADEDTGQIPPIAYLKRYSFRPDESYEMESSGRWRGIGERLVNLHKACLLEQDEAGTYFIADWERQQPPSDGTAAERARKYRERKKLA